jgi:hypothetical protein
LNLSKAQTEFEYFGALVALQPIAELAHTVVSVDSALHILHAAFWALGVDTVFFARRVKGLVPGRL